MIAATYDAMKAGNETASIVAVTGTPYWGCPLDNSKTQPMDAIAPTLDKSSKTPAGGSGKLPSPPSACILVPNCAVRARLGCLIIARLQAPFDNDAVFCTPAVLNGRFPFEIKEDGVVHVAANAVFIITEDGIVEAALRRYDHKKIGP